MSVLTRRDFLIRTGGCAAHLAAASAVLPPALRERWTRPTLGTVVAAEPFGRLEAVGPGVWALVSTPLGGDFTTVSNGGIVAGRNGVLAIEGFMQPAGAKWLAEQAKALTGRFPTHVVLTHYHSDHVNGVAGYFEAGATPAVRTTATTRDWAVQKNQPEPARNGRLGAAEVVDPATESVLDLGGTTVRLLPKAGHTASDLALVVEEPHVVFGGDLLWNGMFPNFVDCVPTLFEKSIRSLRHDRDPIYVPGHGPLARNADLDRYLAMLGEIERAARASRDKGQTAAEGAAGYAIPASLGQWTLFTPKFLETAFVAWHRELGAK
ncbi:MAG: MBL fold metallo-hydrolase [Gemmatimonadales bacterium]|nr:MBL fold metallo-hydrolase [Gemmatimonadales bacterium]